MSEEEKAFDLLLNQYYMTPKNWENYKIIKNAIQENKDLKAINAEHQKINGELRVELERVK